MEVGKKAGRAGVWRRRATAVILSSLLMLEPLGTAWAEEIVLADEGEGIAQVGGADSGQGEVALVAQGAPGGGSSSSSVSWSGATTITSATTTTGKTYSSTTSGQNAVLVNTSDSVTLTSPTVTKSGGTSAGDDESFYGINSAVMCKGGGTTTITGANITTSAGGANGVFSFGGNATTNATSGDGTTVVISDSTITTTGAGSGGIMTTGQGITKASNLTVSTSGASSAAIRSDRGGGTVTVDGGTYKTTGTGSPAVYATATIGVSNATLTSTNSQGVVNEGGNTVVLTDCTLNAGNATMNGQDMFRNGVFLYQSMSGDATEGASVFKMDGGTLNNTYGHVFHVTNTSAAITLEGVDINNSDSEGVLISVCDDAWSGLSNAATVNAVDQTLEGKLLVGSGDTLNMNLSGTSTWTGTTSGSITSHKSSSTVSSSLGTVAFTLSGSAAISLTADTTVSSLSGSGYIDYNGHTLTVGGTSYTSGSIGNIAEKDVNSGESSTTDSTSISAPTAKTGLVYTGKVQTGVASGTGYTLSGTYQAKKAGTYTAKATLKSGYVWSDGTTAAKSVKWTISKAANTLTAKAVKRTARYSKVKRRAVTLARPIKVTKAKGKVTYKVTKWVTKKAKKYLTVYAKTGKVRVKKGTPKGTYKFKVKVTAKGGTNFKAKSKVVTCKIVVK